MDIERHPFDLRECVESAMDLIGPRAAEKHLDIAYVFEGEVPAAIDGDVTRLRQVLLNLLSNSVKFTEKGEVVLSVRTEGDEQTGEGSLLHFTVRDTGIGLERGRPVAAVPEVQPGRQRHHAQVRRHRAGPGHQQAAGRTDGRHDVGRKRRAGPGLDLPLHDALRAGRSCRRASGATSWASSRNWRASASWWWTTTPPTGASWRCRPPSGAWWCRTPSSRRRRLQMLKAKPYDLAILDMHMPDMDGATLAQKIREAGHQLPLVLFSSLGRKEAGDSLFAATLAKPLRQSQLFDTLVSLLAHDEAPKAAPTAAKPRMDAQMAERHPLRILLAEDNVVNQKLALRLLQQMGYRADVASQRHRGHRVLRPPALRRGADGRADARDGRAGGHAPHRRRAGPPRPRARASSP